MKRQMSRNTLVATIVFLIFIVGLGVLLWYVYYQGDDDKDEKNYGLSAAAVVTTTDECTDVAVGILKQGGSAVDSAIAAALCQGITVPQSSGIGGGFLATIYVKNTRIIETLNAREVAPLLATQDLYLDNDTLIYEGGLSIAVPTEVKGLYEMHKKYGVLSWKEIIEPVIEVAEKGFKVTNYLGKVLSVNEAKIRSKDGFKDMYINPTTNDVYKEGDTLKNLKLAQALKAIASEGANAIYSTNGSLGQKLVAEIQANGGVVTMDDLNIYQTRWSPAVSTKLYQGDTLYTTPVPSCGSVLAFILNILEGYKFHENSYEYHRGEKLIYHRIVEAFKFGFGMRTRLGDEINAEIVATVRELMSVDFASHIRTFIDDEQTFNDTSYYLANGSVTLDSGTGHISVLAPNGDAVSLTSTINSVMGSWVMSDSTGLIFNNEMDDFSIPSASDGLLTATANQIKPAKSPMSSMTPMILINENHDVSMIVGGAGGILIMTSLVLFLVHVLYLNQTMETALAMKRFHHQLEPMSVRLEDGFDQPDIVEYFREKGHGTRQSSPMISAFASIVAISIKNGHIETAVDPRRGGKGVVFDPE